MKHHELESRLRDLGWYLLCRGSKHDVWTDGVGLECVPCHAEINESLARKILLNACTKETGG